MESVHLERGRTCLSFRKNEKLAEASFSLRITTDEREQVALQFSISIGLAPTVTVPETAVLVF